MLRGSVPVLVLAMCAQAGVARAQDVPASADAPAVSEEDKAVATALFKEARRLMDTGDVAAACRKFAESQRLDPGGGTLLNLAACHEREGRTASAWTEFSAALAQARKDGRADRASVAQERVTALEARLARLTIVVRDAGAASDLEVTIDGVAVRSPAWGLPLPVDPGAHVVEAHAKGFQPWRGSITVAGDGDKQTVEIPLLAPLPPATPAQPAPTTPAASTPAAATAPSSSFPLRNVVMIGAAAVGVAGVAFGSYFGLHAISLEHGAQGQCPSGRCTDGAVATSQTATTNADLSTGAFVIGAPVSPRRACSSSPAVTSSRSSRPRARRFSS
jgi:hypothetical protein